MDFFFFRSFTVSSRANRHGHVLTAKVKSGLTAYTHYRWKITRVVCPTAATVAIIFYLNLDGKNLEFSWCEKNYMGFKDNWETICGKPGLVR